jgi:hypothetical protein
MKIKKNWIIPVILTVTAGFLVVQSGSNPATPTTTPADAGCAYVWAYHDAPELTTQVDELVRGLDPQATARASLYGEDCAYADGHADFHVMETDFYIRLPVDDLANEKSMGAWAAQVMPLILEIPRGEIQGNYGFAEFWFEKNDLEHAVLRIPIPRYINEAQGKSGGELYRIFSVPP